MPLNRRTFVIDIAAAAPGEGILPPAHKTLCIFVGDATTGNTATLRALLILPAHAGGFDFMAATGAAHYVTSTIVIRYCASTNFLRSL